jgi:hypothetical protein
LKSILRNEVGGYIDLDNDRGAAKPRVDESKYEVMSKLATELRNEIEKNQAPFVLRSVS